MNSNNWNAWTDNESARRRAGGRRRYNARRRRLRILRQHRVVELWIKLDLRDSEGVPKLWGAQAAIARILGVHRSTVCRDFARYFDEVHERSRGPRTIGGLPVTPELLQRIEEREERKAVRQANRKRKGRAPDNA